MQNMLTKNDLNKIKNVIQNVALTKKDAKNFATKGDLKSFATKEDLNPLAKQDDLLKVKEKLNDLTDFSQEAIGNILDWTEEIHQILVKDKLPERVKRLEQIIKSS